MSRDPRDHDAGSQGWHLIVFTRVTELAHQVNNRLDLAATQARPGRGDGDFQFAVGTIDIYRYDTITQRILSFMHPGVFLRIAGKDHPEVGMHFDVGLFLILGRQHQQPFLEHTEQDVVCLSARTSELVIDQRKAFAAGCG